MRITHCLSWIACVLILSSAIARADSPIQAALWPPELQIISEDESIRGVRFNIYGRNQNMTGLDLGFMHETTGDFSGVGLGLVSLVNGAMYGVEWNGIYTRAQGGFHGWPSGIVTRSQGASAGLQTGLVALNDADMAGVQLSGIYNHVKTHISGVQVAIVNHAGDVKGVQLGIANFAENMNGLQIGLWNQIDAKETWKVIPIVNWKF